MNDQRYDRLIHSLVDIDIDEMEEDPRMLVLQRQSLESELATANSKVATLDAELSSVRSILETVSKNFYLLHKSSQDIISRLRSYLKKMHRKFNSPAPDTNRANIINRICMNPLNPFSQLTAEEIRNYLINVTSFPDFNNRFILRKVESPSDEHVLKYQKSRIPVPKVESICGASSQSVIATAASNKSSSSSRSSSTGSSSSSGDSSSSSSSSVSQNPCKVSKISSKNDRHLSNYPRSFFIREKGIQNKERPHQVLLKNTPTRQNQDFLKLGRKYSENTEHSLSIKKSTGLEKNTNIGKNCVNSPFLTKRIALDENSSTQSMSLPKYAPSNFYEYSRTQKALNDICSNNTEVKSISGKKNRRNLSCARKSSHCRIKPSKSLKYESSNEEMKNDIKNTMEDNNVNTINKTRNKNFNSDLNDAKANSPHNQENYVKETEIKSPLRINKISKASTDEDINQVHANQRLPNIDSLEVSCISPYQETLSLSGLNASSPRRYIRQHSADLPLLNHSPRSDSPIIPIHRPNSLPCSRTLELIHETQTSQPRESREKQLSEVSINSHTFIYEDLPETPIETKLEGQNLDSESISNKLHQPGQPRTPEELDDETDELDFGEDFPSNNGLSSAGTGKKFHRSDKQEKAPSNADFENRLDRYREEGKTISDGGGERFDEAEYSDGSSRGKIRGTKREGNLSQNYRLNTLNACKNYHEPSQSIKIVHNHPYRRLERTRSKCPSRDRSNSRHRSHTPEGKLVSDRDYPLKKRKKYAAGDQKNSPRRFSDEEVVFRSQFSYTERESPCSQLSSTERKFVPGRRERPARPFRKFCDGRISPNHSQLSFRNQVKQKFADTGNMSSLHRIESRESSGRFNSHIVRCNRSPMDVSQENRYLPSTRFKSPVFPSRQSRARR